MTSENDPLQQALADLEEVKASPGFSERAVHAYRARLASRGHWSFRFGRAAVAVSAAALIATLALVLSWRGRTNELSQFSAAAQELRRQHSELVDELNRLQSQTNSIAPVVYLGSDNEVDYVLDLSPFLVPATPSVLPTSMELNPSYD